MLDCFGVLISLFCTSSSMGWTSLFDKFKLVSIFSSMCWTYRIFVRPWVGHVEYLLVLGLDMWNIYSSMGWTCSKPYLVLSKVFTSSFIWTGLPCPEEHTDVTSLRPKNFLVHGLGPSFLFLLTG